MTARRARRGSQAVETAIVLPLLLVMFAGIVDLAELMMTRDAMTVAAADGARAGSVVDPDTGEDPVTVALEVADQAYAATERSQVATFSATTSGTAPDRRLVVTGNVEFEPYIGLFPMPSTLTYTNAVRLTFQ